MWFPRRYGAAFVKVLNGDGQPPDSGMVVISDLQNQILQEDIVRDVLAWQRCHMHSFTPKANEMDEQPIWPSFRSDSTIAESYSERHHSALESCRDDDVIMV